MATSPTKLWTKVLGSSTYNAATDLAIGIDGSIFIAGSQLVNGKNDGFLIKYGSDGSKIWAKQIGTINDDSIFAITAGLDGNIYIAGYAGDSLDSQPYVADSDAFIAKYKPDGTKIWTRLLGSSGSDAFTGLAIGLDGSIFASGFTTGSLDGQLINGTMDAFLTKYDVDGKKIWTKFLGSTGVSPAFTMSAGLDGSIYISGSTTSSIDGQSFNGGLDAFLTKYKSDGTKLWTKVFGSNGNEVVYATTTGIDGSIYVSGGTDGSFDGQVNSGKNDAFITKFSPDGVKIWTKLLGTSSDDYTRAMSTGLDGSIYIAGSTVGSLDGQINSGNTDAFLTKLNSDGSKVWTKLLGTSFEDSAHNLKVSSDGSLYVSGYTEGPIDGQAVNGADIFLAKYQVSTITTSKSNLTVLVDKGVLGATPVLLKGLSELTISADGVIIKRTVEYAGSTFDYNQIDPLITTVIRDGEFTAEFKKELTDAAPTTANLTYKDAVTLVGMLNIDAALISIAGLDGNFVG
jgi:hypothetical protein